MAIGKLCASIVHKILGLGIPKVWGRFGALGSAFTRDTATLPCTLGSCIGCWQSQLIQPIEC